MYFAIAASIALFGTGSDAVCSHNTHLYPRNTIGPQFTYNGLTGPLNWHSLHANNSKCAKGTQQTPVNLDGTVTSIASATVVLNYPNTEHAEFENLGTTIEVVADTINGTLSYSGKCWKLNEHRIEDEFYPAEVHFVHVVAGIYILLRIKIGQALVFLEDKSLAVLGFLIEIGANNDPLLDKILPFVNKIPHKGDHTEVEDLDFSALKKHLNTNAIYRYKGSLTTPPCSQDVQWFVSKEPLTMDFLTFNKVKKIVKFNARYAQDNLGAINLLENAKNTIL